MNNKVKIKRIKMKNKVFNQGMWRKRGKKQLRAYGTLKHNSGVP